MPINSRQKGARFEREWSKRCTAEGYPMRRAQQFCGAAGDADCIPTEPSALSRFHFECKSVERLNIYDAMGQAVADSAPTGKTPVVVHKRNHGQALVTMLADTFFQLLRDSDEGARETLHTLVEEE